MNRCYVCDREKRDPYCVYCQRDTPTRDVAPPNALIAPGSALRFRDQAELFRREQGE